MAQQLDLSPYEQWIGDDLSNDLTTIRKQHPEYDFSTVTKKGRAGKPKIGMTELANLVVNMKRDIKKISDAQSFQGAQRVARKLGKGYTAHDEDINNDGIPDAVIRDKLGRPVVVDGYTTTKSSYPYRYAYFTDYPTAEQRRDVPYSEYLRNLNGAKYEDPQNPLKLTSSTTPELFQRAAANGYAKKVAKDRTVYNVFTSDIIKPIFDQVQEELNIKMNKALISVAAFCWNVLVLYPVMKMVYGEQIIELLNQIKSGTAGASEKKKWNRLKAKKAVKDLATSTVTRIYYAPEDQKISTIKPAVQVALRIFMQKSGTTLEAQQQLYQYRAQELMNGAERDYHRPRALPNPEEEPLDLDDDEFVNN